MMRMSVEMAGVIGFRVHLSHDEELETIRESQRIERMATFKKGTVDLGEDFSKNDTSIESKVMSEYEYEEFVLRKYPGFSLKEATEAHEKEVDDKRYAEFLVMLENNPQGTIEEFNALSSEEKDAQWDDFHRMNAQGVADSMYFYQVLMKMYLIDYVGH